MDMPAQWLDPDDQYDSGVLVGFMLPKAIVEMPTTLPRVNNDTSVQKGKKADKKTKSKKGLSIQDMTDFTLIPHQEDALTVVCRISSHKTMYYYVLVNPDDNGICEGQRISVGLVFFLKEWRDDTLTSVLDRQKVWPKRVKKFILRQALPEGSLTHNPMPLLLPNLQQTDSNAIKTLVATYLATGELWVLDGLEQKLVGLDDDLKHQPEASNVALHCLLRLKQPFSIKDGHAAVKESVVSYFSSTRSSFNQVLTSQIGALADSRQAQYHGIRNDELGQGMQG